MAVVVVHLGDERLQLARVGARPGDSPAAPRFVQHHAARVQECSVYVSARALVAATQRQLPRAAPAHAQLPAPALSPEGMGPALIPKLFLVFFSSWEASVLLLLCVKFCDVDHDLDGGVN